MQTIHVALALDRHCVIGCAVSIRSMLENASGEAPFHFHLTVNGVPRRDLDRIEASARGTPHPVSFSYASFDPTRVRELARSKLVTRTAYALLLIQETLPAEVMRCIAVDCDLVFERDATELWVMDLQGHPIAAAHNGSLEEARLYQARIGMSVPRYFNSGMLLVDMVAWREQRIGERALEEAHRLGDHLILHDQDALNAAIDGDWLELDQRWNVWVLDGVRADTPTVLHFMAAPKPWHADCTRPFTDRFFRYLDRTDFAGWRPGDPWGIAAAARRLARRVPYLPGALRRSRLRLREPRAD
jgi:lipopolysaccharide biosynthesis glycosyltransferase